MAYCKIRPKSLRDRHFDYSGDEKFWQSAKLPLQIAVVQDGFIGGRVPSF